MFPDGTAIERVGHFQRLLVHIPRRPQCKSCPNSYLPNSPVQEPPPDSPNGATYEEKRPFLDPSSTHLFTQRKEEPSFRPIDHNRSPLFCPRAVCKPYKSLDFRRSLWATNPVFSG